MSIKLGELGVIREVRDMDKRNKQRKQSAINKRRDICVNAWKERFGRIYGILEIGMPGNTPYFNWDEVFGGAK